MGRNPLPESEKKHEVRGIWIQKKQIDKLGNKKMQKLAINAINNCNGACEICVCKLSK